MLLGVSGEVRGLVCLCPSTFFILENMNICVVRSVTFHLALTLVCWLLLTPPLTGKTASWDVHIRIMLTRLWVPVCPPRTLRSNKFCWAGCQNPVPIQSLENVKKKKHHYLGLWNTFSHDSEKWFGQKNSLVYLKVPSSYHCVKVWNWWLCGCLWHFWCVFETGR